MDCLEYIQEKRYEDVANPEDLYKDIRPKPMFDFYEGFNNGKILLAIGQEEIEHQIDRRTNDRYRDASADIDESRDGPCQKARRTVEELRSKT